MFTVAPSFIVYPKDAEYVFLKIFNGKMSFDDGLKQIYAGNTADALNFSEFLHIAVNLRDKTLFFPFEKL